MSPASLALALLLVVPVAADAQAQQAQKKRRAGQAPVGQELEAQPPAGLERSRAALEQASRRPPAAPAVAPQAAATTASPETAVTEREGISGTIVRGARRAGIPIIMPIGTGPIPPPASPVR